MPSASRNRIRTGTCRVFFAQSATSQRAGQGTLQRIFSSRPDPTKQPTGRRDSTSTTPCARGATEPRVARALSAIAQPVFVANGDSDPMILPLLSYLLAGLIPHARLKIYPDAAHGFLFQHHEEFAADVDAFLAGRFCPPSRSGADVRPRGARR